MEPEQSGALPAPMTLEPTPEPAPSSGIPPAPSQVSDTTTVRSIIDQLAKDWNVDLSGPLKILEDNLIKTVKDLKDASAESWSEWRLPTKLRDELKRIIGLTTVQDKYSFRNVPPYHRHSFFGPPILEPESWELIQHPNLNDLLEKLDGKGTLIALKGRRRTGKTTLLKQACEILQKKGTSFLYLTASSTIAGFISDIRSALKQFDNDLLWMVRTESSSAIIGFLDWLLCSGIYVIIDEFQYLAELTDDFNGTLKNVIDERQRLWRGKLIVLGSHVHEMERIIMGQKSPLFGRGWKTVSVSPWSFQFICGVLKNMLLKVKDNEIQQEDRENLFWLDIVSLYAIFDGVIGYYAELFDMDKKITINSALNRVSDIVSISYTQLSTKQTTILSYITNHNYQTVGKLTDDVNRSSSLPKHSVETVVADLIRYKYITKKNTSLEGYEVVNLIDCPLRVYNQVVNGKTSLETYAGYIFEEIIRSLCIKTSTETLIDWKWQESCTEIDVLYVDELNKIVSWGFCKRNEEAHHIRKNICHILSFFNNRNWYNHDWYTYTHRVNLYSPTFSEIGNRSLLERKFTEEVNRLQKVSRDDLINDCKELLSNVQEGGKKFVASELMPERCALRFDRLVILSLNDLL